MKSNTHTMTRRAFLGLGSLAALGTLAACGSATGTATDPAASSAVDAADAAADAAASTASTASDLAGAELVFVGDDAFAPFRSIQLADDGTQKLQGLDIDVMDEMASRLGFSYTFEAQDFTATLASLQTNAEAFSMPMSANDERVETFDFTRGYYQPLVGVLTAGEGVSSVADLAGKTVSCTTGTVQNSFVTTAAPEAEVHTYDGGDQCLQEVLAGRIDAYVCDGAEGVSMQEANPELTLSLLPREETADYVSVYRIMAVKGASFIPAFDECLGEMLEDGTIDGLIEKWVGADFVWGEDSVEGAGTLLV